MIMTDTFSGNWVVVLATRQSGDVTRSNRMPILFNTNRDYCRLEMGRSHRRNLLTYSAVPLFATSALSSDR